MKRKSFLQVILAGLTLGLLATAASTANAQTANPAISGVIKAYEKALNASDTPAVLGLYGSNPVFVAPNSKGLSGRDAVKSAYEGLFTAIKPSLVFTIHEIVELGDTAYVRSSSEGEVEVRVNNAKVKDSYNELFILRKEQGQWKIHRYIFNSANPPAAN